MQGYGTSPLEVMASSAMLQGLGYMDEFAYSAAYIAGTTTGLGANATVDVQIQINSDSDFIAQEYNLIAWSTAGTIVNGPDFLITIIRSGSGREIFSQQQPIANICGNYIQSDRSFPGRLPNGSSLYQGNGTVTVRLTNRTATNFNTGTARVDFTMRGFKFFYQTNAQGVTGNRQDIFHAL